MITGNSTLGENTCSDLHFKDFYDKIKHTIFVNAVRFEDLVANILTAFYSVKDVLGGQSLYAQGSLNSIKSAFFGCHMPQS
jgi:hypothetical protein